MRRQRLTQALRSLYHLFGIGGIYEKELLPRFFIAWFSASVTSDESKSMRRACAPASLYRNQVI